MVEALLQFNIAKYRIVAFGTTICRLRFLLLRFFRHFQFPYYVCAWPQFPPSSHQKRTWKPTLCNTLWSSWLACKSILTWLTVCKLGNLTVAWNFNSALRVSPALCRPQNRIIIAWPFLVFINSFYVPSFSSLSPLFPHYWSVGAVCLSVIATNFRH